MSEKLGENWIEQCGVTPKRIENWKERQREEERKIRGRGVEERLLYYADFYDLPVIIQAHWTLFKPCFGKWKHMEVYLDKLEDFRNPEAHRRELFPHEIALVLGITGEIRTAVTNFRSRKKPEDEFFSRFERVSDIFGSFATPAHPDADTGRILHPGDEVDFLATAWDPKGQPCEFMLCVRHPSLGGFLEVPLIDWTRDRNLKWTVGEKDIGTEIRIFLYLRSPRPHHARLGVDDEVSFMYTVLPKE